jgi:hypothetical protein
MNTRDLLGAVCLSIALAATLAVPAAYAQTPESRVTLTSHAGSVLGSARDGADRPIAAARLRLRNLEAGRILMTTRGDQEGNFRFTGVPSGSYLVELVDENGVVLGVGQTFRITPAETVATLIRLGARAPWYAGFFSNAAMAAVSSAAGLGVTAVGNGIQPASGRF